MGFFGNTARNMSHSPDEVGDGNFHRCCDPHQRIKGDIFFAPFDIADVVVVQFGALRQFFLAQLQVPAAHADVLA